MAQKPNRHRAVTFKGRVVEMEFVEGIPNIIARSTNGVCACGFVETTSESDGTDIHVLEKHTPTACSVFHGYLPGSAQCGVACLKLQRVTACTIKLHTSIALVGIVERNVGSLRLFND